MLELGVDELTMVLQVPEDKKLTMNPFSWSTDAEILINTFANRANLAQVFGKKHGLDSKPAGYANAYTYGDYPFYFAVAYHDKYVNMGVVVKFSAQALAYYLECSGMQVYSFLQAVQDAAYTVRLSRIDLTADFIDENINPTEIYNGLMRGNLAVFRCSESKRTGAIQYRKVDMTLKGFAVGEEISTVYLGSPQSGSQLRIYDKRMEQIQRKGTHYDKAKECQDWTRFEGVFRIDYAHQLTEKLLGIQTDDELMALIAATIVQKYRIMQLVNGILDEEAPYTQKLLQAAQGLGAILQAPVSRTFDIVRHLHYLFFNSGTLTTLYKVKEVWGVDTLNELVEYIRILTLEWQPNDDCRLWLARNKVITLASHPDFNALMNTYIKSAM